MRFDIVTIFPEFFSGPLDHGIVRRAREAGIADVRLAITRQEKIFVGPKTIVTPSARDLASGHEVLVETRES